MRITSWNILHGQPLVPGESAPFAKVAAELGSDLIALQEIDMGLERSGSSQQAADIAGAMNTQHWGFAPTVHGTPGFDWKKVSKNNLRVFTESDTPLDSHYGIAIASRIPVKQLLRLELGKAWIGMPLLIANEKGKVAPFYVKDEPRVALGAILENGWTVINTHLSFVPFVNIFQLLKVSRWAKKIEQEHSTRVLLVGDFNLPWGIPVRITKWVRATKALSYPSWKPAISFDYILARSVDSKSLTEVLHPQLPISDHRPITVEIN
jgi:endonuclease/exonuclease/phosphatase family metal-dependent hydrolase